MSALPALKGGITQARRSDRLCVPGD